MNTLAELMPKAMSAITSDGCCRLEPFTYPRKPGIMPHLERSADLVPQKLADAFSACRRGLSPWPLFIHGDVGTGKSRFGLLASDWYGGRFFFFGELWDEYVSLSRGVLAAESSIVVPQSGGYIVSSHSWIKALVGPRLLILDDVARRRDTDTGSARELLCKILDARECLPTLAISNLSPAEIEVCYDARAASRLCGRSCVKIVGKDRRLQQNQGLDTAARAGVK